MEGAPRRRKLTKRKRNNDDEGLSNLSLGPCPDDAHSELAWRVAEGAEFAAGDTLATLVAFAGDEIAAATAATRVGGAASAPCLIAPQDGTLVTRLVAEGAQVPNLATTSVALASVRLCRHAVVASGLCAVCGRCLSTSSRESHLKVALSGCRSDLAVDREEAVATSSKERLLKAGKLQLILDIDNTLLEATGATPPPGVSSIRAILLNQGRSLHHIKLRPGLESFLERASQLFEMTLYTHGRREYAHQVARAIDPSRAYFSGRLISTPDDVPDLKQQQQKSLARLFPGGTDLCLVLDDRDDVWEASDATLRHLLLVRPYRYFNHKEGGALVIGRGSGSGGANDGGEGSSSSSSGSDEDSCSQLARCLEVLERVHAAYFDQLHPRGEQASSSSTSSSNAGSSVDEGSGGTELGTVATAAELLQKERRQILAGCSFVFSGVFPLGTVVSETREASWLRRLGGRVDTDLRPWSTHLIATQSGTEKVRAAVAQGLHVVHLDWLWFTVWHQARACEASLKLHDTPLGHPKPRGRPPQPCPLDGGSARGTIGAAGPSIGEDGGNGSRTNSEEEDEPLSGGDKKYGEEDDNDSILDELEVAGVMELYG